MIYTGTILSVRDNSGVAWVKCLKILGKKPRSWGTVANKVVVTIKSCKFKSKFARKEIHKGILIRVKKKISRIDGSFLNFNQNSMVLLTPKGVPIATRVFGPVAKELRRSTNYKLVSMCSKIV